MTSGANQVRETWWSRPCGGREVLNIALPLMISTGSFAVMLFADRMFLLWHSPAEMAASMPAGTLYWAVLCFPLGIVGYANSFVAQYHGARRADRIGAVTWQAFRIGMLTVPLYLCLIPLAPLLFHAAGHEPPVRDYEIVYFQVLMWGAGAAVVSEALSAFFTGRGVTRVVMWVNVAASLLNVLLDYLWVFGYLGFPEMGITGAAWATVASVWFKLGVLWWLMHRPAERQEFQLERRELDWPLLKRLLYYGTPSGLQLVVEAGGFTIMMLAMARFGETAMAATTLAFNVNMVAFVPMVGVAIAVSTLVGQQLTQGRPDLAARATWTALLLALAYNLPFAVGYVAVPRMFMVGHAAGLEAAEFAEIETLAVFLLRFVAAYCLFDATQILFSAAIKGAGDTWFVLGNTFVAAASAVLIGLVGTRLGGGLIWWWIVITGWLCLLGVTFVARFLQGKWQQMRIIEPDLGAWSQAAQHCELATAEQS